MTVSTVVVSETSGFALTCEAVFAASAVNVASAASSFALAFGADIVGTTVGVTSAAGFTLAFVADLAFSAVGVTGALSHDTLASLTGSATNTVVGGATASGTGACFADLAQFALFVRCTGRFVGHTLVTGADFASFAIGVASATVSTLASAVLADGSSRTIAVIAADVFAAGTTEADGSFVAVVVSLATFGALVGAADFAVGTLFVRTTTGFAGSTKAEFTGFAVFVTLALTNGVFLLGNADTFDTGTGDIHVLAIVVHFALLTTDVVRTDLAATTIGVTVALRFVVGRYTLVSYTL